MVHIPSPHLLVFLAKSKNLNKICCLEIRPKVDKQASSWHYTVSYVQSLHYGECIAGLYFWPSPPPPPHLFSVVKCFKMLFKKFCLYFLAIFFAKLYTFGIIYGMKKYRIPYTKLIIPFMHIPWQKRQKMLFEKRLTKIISLFHNLQLKIFLGLHVTTPSQVKPSLNATGISSAQSNY